MPIQRRNDEFPHCPPECPLIKRGGISRLLYDILMGGGNSTATAILVILLGLLGFLCKQNMDTKVTLATISDNQTSGQKMIQVAIDQSVDNGTVLASHEIYLKEDSKFNAEVAKKLHISTVPVYIVLPKPERSRK